MPLPIAEAIGLTLSATGLAIVPAIAGGKLWLQRHRYDYEDDFADIKLRIELLVMENEVLAEDTLFSRDTENLPLNAETTAIVKFKRGRVTLDRAIGLCESYAELEEKDKKAWEKHNAESLLALVVEMEKDLHFVRRFYDLRFKVEAIRRWEVIEVSLGSENRDVEVEEIEEGSEEEDEADGGLQSGGEEGSEVGGGNKSGGKEEGGADERDGGGGKEESEMEGRGQCDGDTTTILYFSMFIVLLSMFASRRGVGSL